MSFTRGISRHGALRQPHRQVVVIKHRGGARAALGSCCIAGAVWFASALPAIRKAIASICVRLGILPEVTTGIANAAELTVPPE
jgi:hypothetical protein